MSEQKWELLRDGVWEPATETELHAFIERMGLHSDMKGVCSHVMAQMLAEITRLRAELAEVTPSSGCEVCAVARCQRRISGLLALPNGWHDGSGLAITDQAGDAAIGLLAANPSLAAAYHIYPMDDGGLLIEFSQAGVDYSTEIGPQGSITQDAALDTPTARPGDAPQAAGGVSGGGGTRTP